MPSRVGTNKCVGNRSGGWAGARSWGDSEAGLGAQALVHTLRFSEPRQRAELGLGCSGCRGRMVLTQENPEADEQVIYSPFLMESSTPSLPSYLLS